MPTLIALMLAAAPAPGATAQAQATATILPAARVDFVRFDAETTETAGRWVYGRYRTPASNDGEAPGELRLIEFE